MPSPAKQARRRVSPEWKAWRIARKKLRALALKSEKSPAIMGQKWKDSMVKSYWRRYDELAPHEPPKYLE